MSRNSKFLVAGAAFLVLIGAVAFWRLPGPGNAGAEDALSLLARELEKIGYDAYRPPRGDWGPGYVFRAETIGTGAEKRLIPKPNPSQREICSALFAPDIVSRVGLSLPEAASSGSLSIEAGLELLRGLTKDKVAAKANLADHYGVTKFSVHWCVVEEHKIPDENLYDETGAPVSVTPRCLSAIQKIKESGKLNELWVITKAIAVESLDLSFHHEKKVAVGTEISWKKALELDGKVDAQRLSDETLRISEQRFVGYGEISRLQEWLPKGTVSATSRIVQVKLQRGGGGLRLAEK